MTFLIQIPQLIFGGAEKVLVSFANDLVSRGHSVEILEIYEKGLLKDQFDPRVTFHAICSHDYTAKYYASLSQIRAATGMDKLRCCGKQLFSKIVGYRKFAEKLAAKHYAEHEFDVAINYLETDSPKFLLDCIQAKKYLQWIHIDISQLENPADLNDYLPLYERMDGIVCVSQIAKNSFAHRYPSLALKTVVIYNFYDRDDILQKGGTLFSFDSLRPVLLSVGRMTEQKKYLRFLDVLARLRDEGFDFSWHVLGAGIQEDEIRAKIAALKLEDRVFLDGLTDNPYKYMKNCDLFVLPSGWEGFPTVTVEAKILGCPVLATEVAGIREQLRHGETGWIVENSEEGIFNGLKHFFLHSELQDILRNKLGMEQICENTNKYRKLIQLCEVNDT